MNLMWLAKPRTVMGALAGAAMVGGGIAWYATARVLKKRYEERLAEMKAANKSTTKKSRPKKTPASSGKKRKQS